ncbi:thioredoxin domain-containing protein [Actinocrispum sp. NPDC049592]|uniref:DsbA family protein n=1 Tax=Actinocrispum sp. NPDC049592 TaxID=3154835 RepID=UPI003416A8A0
MGGAERTARKRRQEIAAKRAVAAARQAKSDRNKVIITVVVLVVVAAAVIVGVVISNSQKNKTADAAIPTKSVTLSSGVTAKRDGATVLVGKDTAKTTVDVYEDFLCPVCGNFESTYAQQLEQKVNDGTIKINYHLVNLLNDRSDPVGYSTDSANAALCVADAAPDKFMAFHASLYGTQPEEGARGYDKNQLIKLAQDLGVNSPTLSSCVNGGSYNQAVSDAYQKARTDPALAQEVGGQTGFGTPTVLVNNKLADWQDPKWMDALVSQS